MEAIRWQQQPPPRGRHQQRRRRNRRPPWGTNCTNAPTTATAAVGKATPPLSHGRRLVWFLLLIAWGGDGNIGNIVKSKSKSRDGKSVVTCGPLAATAFAPGSAVVRRVRGPDGAKNKPQQRGGPALVRRLAAPSSSSSSVPNVEFVNVTAATTASTSAAVPPGPPVRDDDDDDDDVDDVGDDVDETLQQQRQELLALKSKTVKELKHLIEAEGLKERGLWNKLKVKQDMVDYVIQMRLHEKSMDDDSGDDDGDDNRNRKTNNAIVMEPTSLSSSNRSTSSQPSLSSSSTATSRPRGATIMPPKTAETATASPSGAASPRSLLLRRVYEQYPPLRNMATATAALEAAFAGSSPNRDTDDDDDLDNGQHQPLQPVDISSASATTTIYPTLAMSGLGEFDLRQRCHPMLASTFLTPSSVAVSSPPPGKNHTAVDNAAAADTGDTSSSDADGGASRNVNLMSGEMDLIFVGTASCTPSVTRGVSCTALRLNRMSNGGVGGGAKSGTRTNNGARGATPPPAPSGNAPLGTWLFDCGEATQLQIQRTSSVRPSKISKIFLTHAHGDHSFGLPGLLCLMGQDRGDRATSTPVDIYGPEGLRMWLRVAIRYSVSRIVPNYRVHELKDVPMAPEWEYSRRHGRSFYKGLRGQQFPTWGMPYNGDRGNGLQDQDFSSWTAQCHRIPLEASLQYGEVEGGRDIFPHYNHPLSSDGAPLWEVESVGGEKNDDVRVYAAPMSHGIPCVGYAIHESNRPGRLRDELVKPICERNVQALKDSGFVHPMKAMAIIKSLPPGSSFTFPDGTVVKQEDAVEPPRRGRKVVVCGDTACSRSMEGLAKDADVVVHEATNTFLHGLDKDNDLRSVTRDAVVHGHSTPYMAGEFCKRVGAKRLILNHFSARYKGDPTVEAISIMTRIEDQAIKASGLSRTKVAAAWDFMIFPVPASTEIVEPGAS